MKRVFKEKLSINIGDASDMLTGNRFKTFSCDEAREVVTNLLKKESLRSSFSEILLGLCAIIRVINSQHRQIDLPRFKALCTEVHHSLCINFPWAVISPSIHRVLAHSWEVVQMNENQGLGNQSEEGLETQNKFVRHLQIHGARKTSVEDNFHDVFGHLWRKSSPRLVHMDRKKRSKKSVAKRPVVQSKIDNFVESLFMEGRDK